VAGRKVSGSWKDSSRFYDLPPALHVADPRHQHPGHEPSPGEFAHQAPSSPAAAPAGTEWFGTERVLQTDAPIRDLTPWVHEQDRGDSIARATAEDLDVAGGNTLDQQREARPAHTTRTRQSNYLEKIPEFFDEKYLDTWVEGFGPEFSDGIPALAGGGQRGLNGYSVNNPPLESYGGRGFRYGFTEWQRVYRKFQARIIQRHDHRAWTPNIAYAETGAKPGTTQYQSPLATLQRVIENVGKRPEQREQPPDLADTLAGTPSPSEMVYQPYGIGG